MKRIITLTFCAIVSMAIFGATVQRAILSHNGKLTQFDQNHWLEAIEQAVDNDTVFLSAGSFPGNLTITKKITIIGVGVGADDAFYKDTDIASAYANCAKTGESTTIGGDIIIAIPGNVTLTKTLLENIRLSGNGIAFTEPVTSPVIKRCQVGMIYTNWWSGGTLSASAEVTNLSLENCYIWNVSFENFENPDVHNCYFDKIEPTREGTQFTNCAIMDIWGTSNCTFENCIVHFATGSSNTCLNCLYDGTYLDSHTQINSWEVGGGQCLTKAQLQEGGYIGTDGTVVGPLGGSAPFTLIPAQPYVSSSTLSYNKSTKKLTVKATVKKGQ